MLRVENLSKVFVNTTDQISGGTRDAAFTLENGTFFTLLGPSGCGKTTTLRCIAGLETPDEGLIEVDGTPLFDSARRINVPPDRRAIGMVFQSYAIWPHMTVAENVAFPLTVAKHRRYSRAEIEQGVQRALAIVGLDGFQQRPSTRLSGGQQQRVALARAVVQQPGLLLLDEPLSNLDAQLREDMRGELKRLQGQIGITTVYVTHDQSEALALSDRIAILDQGRIMQIGSPEDVYFRPANVFVARFVGATNLLEGTLLETRGGQGAVELAGGRKINCAVPDGARSGAVSVSIRPETIRLAAPTAAPPASGDNVLAGRVSQVTFLGAVRRVDVVSEGVHLHATVAADVPLPGDGEVMLMFMPERAIVLPQPAA
jgi:iron(III) transport system ATP-binding protein